MMVDTLFPALLATTLILLLVAIVGLASVVVLEVRARSRYKVRHRYAPDPPSASAPACVYTVESQGAYNVYSNADHVWTSWSPPYFVNLSEDVRVSAQDRSCLRCKRIQVAHTGSSESSRGRRRLNP